jgi:nitrate reductase assembly molybdenum cofactor insertion protein NarJ
MKHSLKLHITERFQLSRTDPNQLVVEMKMEDPEALEAPYNRTFTFRRERDWNLMEFVCAENDRNPIGADGLTKFK